MRPFPVDGSAIRTRIKFMPEDGGAGSSGASAPSAGSGNQAIGPDYRDALRAAENAPLRATEGHLQAASGSRVYSSAIEGVSLHLCVDGREKIVSGGFENASGDLRPLIKLFINMIIEMPLQEAADHGVIRLENSLRSVGAGSAGKGVIAPENADPCFATLLKLIRGISSQRAARENGWRAPYPKQWESVADADRLQLAEAAIRQAMTNKGIPDPGLSLIGLKKGSRLVIAYPFSPENQQWHHHLLPLEAELRRSLGVEVELLCEDLKDRNRRAERNATVAK
jgi:hypothetical protein